MRARTMCMPLSLAAHKRASRRSVDGAGMGAELKQPSLELLPGFVDALNRGWSPDNVRGEVTAARMLKAIGKDPVRFVASMDDREARGESITLPDGSVVPRLPGFNRWI